MRLLIVGALEGQLSQATKLAMDGGAKVAHAASVEIALATLQKPARAPICCWSTSWPTSRA